MQYSQRELRAANMLALTFLGLGLAFAGLGLAGLADNSFKSTIAVKADSAKLGNEDPAGTSKKDPRLSAPVGLLLAGDRCMPGDSGWPEGSPTTKNGWKRGG